MTDLIEWSIHACTAGLIGCVLCYLWKPSRFQDSDRRAAIGAVGCFVFFTTAQFYQTKAELNEVKAASKATETAHAAEVRNLAAIIERQPEFRAPSAEEAAAIWNAVINSRKAAFTDGRMRRGTKGEGRGARRIDDGLQRVSSGSGE